ncbi:MAG: sulfotransferase family protein [Actinomycetota bacterium]
MMDDNGGRLPTFLIIGSLRCGTTAMYSYLREHPEVFVNRKEPHFFDLNFEHGLDWYRSLFEGSDGFRAVGEGTPMYMYVDRALTRIAEVLPHVRLLMMLRDPVDRAYSHYWMERTREREERSFDVAVRAEIGSGSGEVEGTPYLGFGRYAEHLGRVCSVFDRSALHVEILEDMERDPGSTYARVCRFLGIDDAHRPDNLGKQVNAFLTFRWVGGRRLAKKLPGRLRRTVGKLNAKSESYPPMSVDTRALLEDYFTEPNRRTAAWLGRDLSELWPSATLRG